MMTNFQNLSHGQNDAKMKRH